MKQRILICGLSLLLTFSLAGCGGQQAQQEPQDPARCWAYFECYLHLVAVQLALWCLSICCSHKLYCHHLIVCGSNLLLLLFQCLHGLRCHFC